MRANSNFLLRACEQARDYCRTRLRRRSAIKALPSPPGKRISFIVSIIAVIGVAQPAFANFTCSGTLSYLSVNSGGSVYVAVGPFGVWAVCALGGTVTASGTTVSPDACRAWYAGFLAAKRAEASVTLYFLGPATDHNGSSCTGLGSWVVAAPYHIDFP
jgi:hypothetical protein